jgi:uncharacterized protein (DUF2141 family)
MLTRHPARVLTPLSLFTAFTALLSAMVGTLAAPSAAQEILPSGVTGRTIVVTVARLRNDSGRVMGGLYSTADSWLVEDHADGNCRASIRGGRARCVFTNIPPGPVAFAGMHDEDGDGVFDRDLLGLPSEGYAFSNDVREPLGPPSFLAASFATDVLVVHTRYGI